MHRSTSRRSQLSRRPPRRDAEPTSIGLVAVALAAGLVGAVSCSSSEATTPTTPIVTTGSGLTGGGGSLVAGGGTGGDAGSGATAAGGTGGEGGVAPSCPSDPLPPGEHQLTIRFDELEREYEVQVPLDYDNGAPVALLFDIHGYMSDKDQQQLVSGFEDLAEQEGFVVVRPNGYGLAAKSWNGGNFCCGEAHALDLDDVGLMRAIAAEISSELCIDPRRIYATGISNGGALTHRLACEAADLFAAIAPVSYPLDFDPLSDCQPSRPIAVMHLHGRYDMTVPYGGTLNQVPVTESFAYWAEANDCTGAPVVTYENDGSECETYDSCGGDVETTLCSLDGDHVLYYNYDDVPVAELAWHFLSAFERP